VNGGHSAGCRPGLARPPWEDDWQAWPAGRGGSTALCMQGVGGTLWRGPPRGLAMYLEASNGEILKSGANVRVSGPRACRFAKASTGETCEHRGVCGAV
jgi:hypothetical protein